MTAVGCDTVEVNPPQHSIKQREKCGLATVFAICGAAVLVQIGIAFTWDWR